jgi:hypothetical protein
VESGDRARLLGELLDTAQVADELGLAHPQNVRKYRQRYQDFPSPAREFQSGRCPVWWGHEIQAFKARHPRLGQRRRR